MMRRAVSISCSTLVSGRRGWPDETHCYSDLDAFFHCNGCGIEPEQDPGMQEKIDRLQAIGVAVVHIGVCAVKDRETMALCPAVEKIVELLSEKGISVVLGTH